VVKARAMKSQAFFIPVILIVWGSAYDICRKAFQNRGSLIVHSPVAGKSEPENRDPEDRIIAGSGNFRIRICRRMNRSKFVVSKE
jgi:hypothetical protein